MKKRERERKERILGTWLQTRGRIRRSTHSGGSSLSLERNEVNLLNLKDLLPRNGANFLHLRNEG